MREREAYDAGKRGQSNPHPKFVIWYLMGKQDRVVEPQQEG